ncbi:microtubule-associated protein futsch-like [Branchiostoma lanceolatum]|uniref:microtubule-associated protein futsch-like n=1 Tax=Branchiostoma lanceolatum TaxID=7740 RepID=UPI00345695BB
MGDQTVTVESEGDQGKVEASLEDVDSKPQRAISDIGAKNRLSWYNFFSRARETVPSDAGCEGQQVAADDSSAVAAASVESGADSPPAGSTPNTSEDHSSSLEDWFLSNEVEHEEFISEVQLDTLVILEVEEDEPVRQKGDWYTLLWRSHSESSSGSPSEGDRRWSIAEDFEVSPILTKIMEEEDQAKDTDNNNGLMCDLEHLEMTGRYAPMRGDPEEPLSGHHPAQVETEAGTEVQKDPVQTQIEKSLMRWLDAGFQAGSISVEESETDDSYEDDGSESYDSDDEDEDEGDVFFEEVTVESSPEAFSPFLQGQMSDTPNEAIATASYFGIASPYVRSTLQRRLSVILERSDSDSSVTELNITHRETNKQEAEFVVMSSMSGKQTEETTSMTLQETNVHNSVGPAETTSERPSLDPLDATKDNGATKKETLVPSSLCPGGATEESNSLKTEATEEDIQIPANSSAKTALGTEKAFSVTPGVTEKVDTDLGTSKIADADISIKITPETKMPNTNTSVEATFTNRHNELENESQEAHTVASSLEHPDGETTDVKDIEKGQSEHDNAAALTKKADKLRRISMNASIENDVDVNERNDINANNIRAPNDTNEVDPTAAEMEKYIHMTLNGLVVDVYPTVETVPLSITTAVLNKLEKKETQNKDVEKTAIECEIHTPETLPGKSTNEEDRPQEGSVSVTGKDAGNGNRKVMTAIDQPMRRVKTCEDNDENGKQITDNDQPYKTSVAVAADMMKMTWIDDRAADRLGNAETENAEHRPETTESNIATDRAEISETKGTVEKAETAVHQPRTPSNNCDMYTLDTIGGDGVLPGPKSTDVTEERPQIMVRRDNPAQLNCEDGEEHSQSKENDSTTSETKLHDSDDTDKDSSAIQQECGDHKDCRETKKREEYNINNSVPEMQMMNEWLSTVLTSRSPAVSESSSTDSDSEDESGWEVADRTEVYVCDESGSDSEEGHGPDIVDVPNSAVENVGKKKKGKCAVQ